MTGVDDAQPDDAQPDDAQPGPLVRAIDLEVGHGLPVCAPVSFTVAPGDVVAVVGANGAGKSTLLRTLVGLLEPLAGSVEVLGRPVDERSQAFRSRVARDLGEDTFLPALTVREHLLLTAAGHGVEEPAPAVDALVEAFGLSGRARALPAALSSGQRRRLLLASAFVRPFRLLVLDEPEQRLDTAMRRDVAERLVAAGTAGAGVLLATHDPTLLRRSATAAVVLDDDACRVVGPDEAASVLEQA